MIVELLAAATLGLPTSQQACAVTRPTAASGRYGGRRLWTYLPPGGILRARRDDDGTLFQKLGWIPDRFRGELTVTGRLVGAPTRMRVLGVNWGYASTGKGSWASAVTFPRAGCWRITGTSAGVTLSYVVRVVPV